MTTPSALREERQRFLWSSSQAAHATQPELARVLMLGLDQLAIQHASSLPLRAVQRTCGSCFSPLVPGINCHITQKKHPSRPAARRWSLQVHCRHCAHIESYAVPPKPSARSHLQAPKAAKQACRSSSSVSTPAAPLAPRSSDTKRKRNAAASSIVPLQTEGDSLFGFDFVPLT